MAPLLPDAFVMLAIVVAWLNDTFNNDHSSNDASKAVASRRLTAAIALFSTLIAAVWYAVQALTDPHAHYFFSNMYVVDPFANLIKAFVALAYAVSLVYARSYLEMRQIWRADYYLLGMFSLLGQLVMTSGNNFLTLYLGLELMSLSLYAVIALRKTSPSANEAAMKYYVLGALASGFVLYGISMLYGATGTLDLTQVYPAVQRILHASASLGPNHADQMVLIFGVVFIVAGVAFKLGAVPFHMWVPDVYQGSPTAMTVLVGGGPKLAAIAWGMRLLLVGLLPLAVNWQPMLMILAALSLVVGNITGIAQKNIKRMLAYSAIANMGFVLLGLLSGVASGATHTDAYSAAIFYGITYLLTTLGSFGVVMLLSRGEFEAESIDDLKGLSKRHPLLAFVMLIFMFSLAGIPPAVGFYAKLAVLEAAIQAGLVWLAVLAVITSLFGAFYYLRIVKLMYFDEPQDTSPLATTPSAKGMLLANGAAVLLLGILPGPLLTVCQRMLPQMLSSLHPAGVQPVAQPAAGL